MYLAENPVLQRELLVNLRMPRAFVLLFLYQALLGLVVYFAWPQDTRLDLTENPAAARKLVDLFFLGQYVLASMMTPSFAAGAITGEKERKTYEMLLASPLQPAAIVLGKMLASLAHLAALIFSSLPIVMLCLPLGGVSLYEVLAAYLGLIVSVVCFGMISIACSSYFGRTLASLVVSYLIILPLAIIGVLLWYWLSDYGEFRLLLTITLLPGAGAAICIVLFFNTSARLLHPPDVGSEGKEVVDLEQEAQQAVGLVIQPNQFPDMLFAPAKRDTLMSDGANPVYDKEVRSEIFSQGTLMLRVVIQVSMLVAIPLMAACLYIFPQYAASYIAYVVTFNMLVGPVFSAGSVTSERERQTLDLLLTTTITPWQILWGKLIAGLRISSVLTMFLVWPVFLACLMVHSYWPNLAAVGAFFVIILLTCLTTAMLALFCSVIFHKTSVSLVMSYLMIIVLFVVPVLAGYFASNFFPNLHDEDVIQYVESLHDQGKQPEEIARELVSGNVPTRDRKIQWTSDEVQLLLSRSETNRWVERIGVTSPFAAAFSLPLDMASEEEETRIGDTRRVPKVEQTRIAGLIVNRWAIFAGYVLFTIALNLVLLGLMIWMFNTRWRVAE